MKQRATPTAAYMAEPWYRVLVKACQEHPHKVVAQMIGASAPAISQVLNASGKYGGGKASTVNIGRLVLSRFGSWECPHLTAEDFGESRVITAQQCQGYAHRTCPSTAQAIVHWRACNACPNKAIVAPRPELPAKPPQKRKPRATRATDHLQEPTS